jgi:lysophospholipase L1-like esterase
MARRIRTVLFQAAVVIAFFAAAEAAVRTWLPRISSTEYLARPDRLEAFHVYDPAADPLDPFPDFLERQTACRCEGEATCRLLPPFREREFSCEPSPGVARVLVVGESSVYGDRLTEEEAIPAVVERSLRARGIGAEVVNAGVSGTGMTGIRATTYFLASRLRPHLVILYAGHNETYPMRLHYNSVAYHTVHRYVTAAPWVYRHSALLRSAAYLYSMNRTEIRRREFLASGDFREADAGPPILLDEATFADLAKLKTMTALRARSGITTIRHDMAALGIRLVFAQPTGNLMLPPLSSTHGPGYLRDPDAWDTGWDRASRAWKSGDVVGAERLFADLESIDPHHALTFYLQGRAALAQGRVPEARALLERALEEIYVYRGNPAVEGAAPSLFAGMAEEARRLGVPVWEAGPALRGGDDPSHDPEFFQDYVHYTPGGAARIAEPLAAWLADSGLLNGASTR